MMNKKERRAALFSLLSSKAVANTVKVVESLAFADAKTKNMQTVVDAMIAKSAVFALLPNESNAYMAARNIATIKPINVSYLNPADLLKYNDLVFTKASLERLVAIYS
jgi:large subunit ribosomal protein L4